jgi:hypothetical protein
MELYSVLIYYTGAVLRQGVFKYSTLHAMTSFRKPTYTTTADTVGRLITI